MFHTTISSAHKTRLHHQLGRTACLTLFGSLTFMMLQGCNSGSDKADVAPGPGMNVTGNAIKGALNKAKVNIYGVDATSTFFALGAGLTDSAGHFSVPLSQSYSGPILIKVQGQATGETTMRCDYPLGCGSFNDVATTTLDDNGDGLINFGESFAVSDEFSMEAVADVENATPPSFSVSPLTHMAAAYAKRNALTSESVDTANKYVSEQFGLIGDITLIPVVDVSQIAALDDSSQAVQTLTHGILASTAFSFGANPATLLNDLATSFSSDHFVGTADRLNLEAYLDAAALTNQRVAALNQVAGSHANSVGNALLQVSARVKQNKDKEKKDPKNDDPNPTPVPLPDSSDGQGDLQKAKKLVTDIRSIAYLLDSGSKDWQLQVDNFKSEIEVSANIVNAALGDALASLAKFELEVRQLAKLPLEAGSTYYIQGVALKAMEISNNSSDIQYSFQAYGPYDSQLIDLNINASYKRDPFNGTVRSPLILHDAQLNIEGKVSNDTFHLSIGSGLMINGKEHVATTFNFEPLISSTISLKASIFPVVEGAFIGFDGTVKAMALGYPKRWDIPVSEATADDIDFKFQHLNVAGDFIDGDVKILSASIALSDIYYSNHSHEDYWTTTKFWSYQASASIRFSVYVTGLPQTEFTVSGPISGFREYYQTRYWWGPETRNTEAHKQDWSTFSLDVTVNNKTLNISAEREPAYFIDPKTILYISNRDSMRLAIYVAPDGIEQGFLGLNSADSPILGTISRNDSGIYLVRYRDGSFESIN